MARKSLERQGGAVLGVTGLLDTLRQTPLYWPLRFKNSAEIISCGVADLTKHFKSTAMFFSLISVGVEIDLVSPRPCCRYCHS
jgi:hypothetical protein